MTIYTMETSLGETGQGLFPDERLALLKRLDEIGFAYVDSGPPGEFLELQHARLCCRVRAEEVDAALESEAPGVIVAGGSEEALAAAIRELRSRGREVIFEAADFFASFARDRRDALQRLEVAKAAGANVLCLADERGGTLPADAAAICAEVRKHFPGILAIRPGGELAVSCAIEAIGQGFTLVAGPAGLLATVAKFQERLGCTLFDAARLPELELLAEEIHSAAVAEEDDVCAGAPFAVLGFEVSTRMRVRGQSVTTATVTIDFHDNVLTFTADGVGPINAMDHALRGCLASLYPALGSIRLADYRVKVLDRRQGTASRVRVSIDWTDGERRWTTTGVSRNVVEASWLALAESVRREMVRLADRDECMAADESWAV